MGNLKKYGSELIVDDLKDAQGRPIEIDFGNQKDEVNSTLARVYRAFGPYSTSKLIRMTHQNPAWMETKKKETITTEAMLSAAKKLYFD